MTEPRTPPRLFDAAVRRGSMFGIVPRLLVITPTRGRPANIKRLLESWADTWTGHAVLLLCIDNDDPDGDAVTAMWHELTHPEPPNPPVAWIDREKGQRRRMGGWTNEIALRDHGFPYVGSFGDDHYPRTVGWDKAICDALDELGTGFAYPDDGFESQGLPTACAMTADIPKTLGWMCLPTLQHLYVDLVWRDLGQAIERYKYLPDVLVEHLSTYNHKAEEDDTSRDHWNDAAKKADEAAYVAWCNGRGAGRDGDFATLTALVARS